MPRSSWSPTRSAANDRRSKRRRYQSILITVSLEDFDKPFFVAAGQVEHPGKYELRSEQGIDRCA